MPIGRRRNLARFVPFSGRRLTAQEVVARAAQRITPVEISMTSAETANDAQARMEAHILAQWNEYNFQRYTQPSPTIFGSNIWRGQSVAMTGVPFQDSNVKRQVKKLEVWCNAAEEVKNIEDMTIAELKEASDCLKKGYKCFGQRHKMVTIERVLKEKTNEQRSAKNVRTRSKR